MRERVLITVKTYPTLSKSYGELVCTAGVREDGSWVRLYPVPFRRLEDYDKHYKKYQWITADLIPRKGDIRPESFAPVLDTLEPCDVITTGKNREWSARKESTLMIIDWEIGMLYWNCLKRTDGDEQIALEKVRLKYYDEFVRTDLHLFLGTTKQFHSWGSNPFVVIGTFTPPKTSQMELPF